MISDLPRSTFASERPERPIRILVVDDDVSSARLLAQIVNDLGEVTVTGDGREAIELVRRQPPDVILLDGEMPGLNGYETCKTIKLMPTLVDVPILFVTAYADTTSEVRALESGAADFIPKPLNPAVVRARLKTQIALKQRTDQLSRLAVVDSLTGIANRRAFDHALEQECRRACRAGTILSLLLVDIDHFKLFNDHYGHQAGDECLRKVGTTLAACVRRPGEVAARYGGEEFALVLPVCDRDDALGLGEKTRKAIEGLQIPHARSKTVPFVTVSVGVASVDFTLDVKDSGPLLVADALREAVLSLIQTADGALYDAKRGGRNRIAWSEAPAS